MSRTLRLLCLLLSTAARAQITGSDCSYADGTLCVPTYCAAPKLVTTHQELDAAPLSFRAPNASRVTETVEFTPNFNGYQLHRTCPDTVTEVDPFAGGGAECGSGSFANCTAKKKPYKWPKGCAAISPLPTYVAGTEDCVESDFPAPHNKSFCDPGNGVLIGSVGSLMAVWVVCILLLFYAMALVCEEFLVPAINIVCERTGIPDDVAGATLLAAGCNSPEFFSSIIGIFIADSTVGVGTVVGSAPFNVCCITAGAAIAVGGQLYLDPWLMGRELLALFFALWMFLFVMDDYLVHWWEAGLMVAYYAFVYVPTLAFFDQIKKGILFVVTCGAPQELLDELDADLLDQIDAKTGASVSLNRPAAAASGDGSVGASGKSVGLRPSGGAFASVSTGPRGTIAKSLRKSLALSQRVAFAVPQREPVLKPTEGEEGQELQGAHLKPVALSPDDDIERFERAHAHDDWGRLVDDCRRRADAYAPDADGATMSGKLLKKSRFYSRVRMGKRMWQERWFVLDSHPTNPLRYSRFGADGNPLREKFVTVPLQEVTEIKRVSQEELHLVAPDQTYVLRLPVESAAPATAEQLAQGGALMQRWFDAVIVKLDEVRKTAPPAAKLAGEEHEGEHEHGPWYALPKDGAIWMVMHFITLPIKALVFATTPDVQHGQPSIWSRWWSKESLKKLYIFTILIAMVWLAIFATLMTDIIEYLGCGLGIDTTVMGLSLGAIGTSFPNLYASILVAKAGMGGMSICQAIASNTFNICICLALLWFVHGLGAGTCDYGYHQGYAGQCAGCYAPSGFAPLCPYYEGTNNEYGSAAGSTKGAVLVVFVWYAVFLITLVVGRNSVGIVPAAIMFVMYLVYITYEFVAAYVPEIAICFGSINICI